MQDIPAIVLKEVFLWKFSTIKRIIPKKLSSIFLICSEKLIYFYLMKNKCHPFLFRYDWLFRTKNTEIKLSNIRHKTKNIPQTWKTLFKFSRMLRSTSIIAVFIWLNSNFSNTFAIKRNWNTSVIRYIRPSLEYLAKSR